jgi:hypothetical protein
LFCPSLNVLSTWETWRSGTWMLFAFAKGKSPSTLAGEPWLNNRPRRSMHV